MTVCRGSSKQTGGFLAGLVLCASVVACHREQPVERPFNALTQRLPNHAPVVAGVELSPADYRQVLSWGVDWFRYETFGGERTVTDVLGLLNAPIEVPCSSDPAERGCYRRESSLSYFVKALDALDGVSGNLYTGNGGPDGSGYTHDLALRFPPGSKMHGLPLPTTFRTGLDVEAGSAWPIGLVPVPVSGADANLPYIWDLARLGVGPAPEASKVRVGIACALCHFSLDVDWDGRTDLKSARWERPTPGSPFRPEQSWSVGNQDLKVGSLFAMSQNPLMGFTIFSGPIGRDKPERAIEWVRWIKERYQSAPATVTREVVRGMQLLPRGYADVTSNGRYNMVQIPPLYTHRNWPSNSDGAVVNPIDRDSVVWTATLDFTGIVGLTGDRGGAGASGLYWQEPSIYSVLSAQELADIMVYLSPAALHDPRQRELLRDDILGVSDGVPGLLDPDSVFVMQGPGNVLPPEVLNHPDNLAKQRIRRPEDFPGDAAKRGPVLALLGLHARTRPKVAADPRVAAWLRAHPGIQRDDFMAEAVNAVLDWQPPPPNLTARLARARANLPRGQEIFNSVGCATCHRGASFTDNVIHRLSARRSTDIGIAPPSTSPWRSLGRGSGPALGTEPSRSHDSRPLSLYVAPTYDPATGQAVSAGNPLVGLFGGHVVGYKSTQLYYLWGSAPYLHDGGVGVAIAPASNVDRDALASVLRLPEAEKVYGMGAILAFEERHPGQRLRPDAALSLQALLLRSEREQILERKAARVIPVPGVAAPDAAPEVVLSENLLGAPAFVSAVELGIDGAGHDFYIDDVPGGENITALIAFLLALDDAPGETPH